MKCVKMLVFVFNFIFFAIGCALLGIGVYLNVKYKDYVNVSDFNFISVANVAIAAGVLIALIAFLGCCGAVQENKCMLLTFAIFLILIFILEIGAGIAAYVMRGKVEDKLKEQLNKRIPDEYYKEKGVRIAVDLVQNNFHCCGVENGPANYDPKDVPESCCKDEVKSCTSAKLTITNKDNYVGIGCYTKVKNWIKKNLQLVGICGIVFAVVQIMGIMFSLCLYRAVSKESMA